MARWIAATLAVLLLALSAAPAAAVAWVRESSATLRWDAAQGPVHTYGVWIRRNGEAFGELPDLWVEGTEVTVSAESFDQVVVRIAAFDETGRQGPFSPDSEPIVFVPPPEPPPLAEPARPFDLDGDGATDLAWHSAFGGQLLLVRLDEDLSLLELEVFPLEPGEEVVGSGDFDADGRADLLLRVAGAGSPRIWFMDGLARREERELPAIPGTIEALADFDGDGRTDLLWHLPSGRGDVAVVTFLEGAAVASVAVLGESPLRLTAAPDLDGDGLADALFHDPPGRRSEAWLLDADRIREEAALPAPPWPNAELVGTGDLDADGDDDLLWQLPGAGGLRLWFMDGFRALSVSAWTYSDTQYVHSLGDYDGDGRVDDALIRDAVTGASWIGRFDWNGSSGTAPPETTAIFSLGPEWIPVAN